MEIMFKMSIILIIYHRHNILQSYYDNVQRRSTLHAKYEYRNHDRLYEDLVPFSLQAGLILRQIFQHLGSAEFRITVINGWHAKENYSSQRASSTWITALHLFDKNLNDIDYRVVTLTRHTQASKTSTSLSRSCTVQSEIKCCCGGSHSIFERLPSGRLQIVHFITFFAYSRAPLRILEKRPFQGPQIFSL
jgi:hypothetical protein